MQVDLILNDPGRAITRLPHALFPVFPDRMREIATCVFQSPGILIPNVPQEKASNVASVLRELGADISVSATGSDVPVSPRHDGDYEAAITVKDLQKLPGLIEELSILLRLSTEDTKSVLFRSPAVLLGQLSFVSAQAVKKSLSDFGASVMLSKSSEARYDLYVGRKGSGLRDELYEVLRRLGVRQPERARDIDQPLVAAGIDESQAKQIWERFSVAGDNVRLINQAFYAFDLLWIGQNETADASVIAQFMKERFNMPEKAYASLQKHRRIVLSQDLTFEQANELVAALSEIGVKAEAELVTLQSYMCKVGTVSDVAAATKVATFITNMDAAAVRTQLSKPTGGQFHCASKLQARWLQYALKQCGAKASIESHGSY